VFGEEDSTGLVGKIFVAIIYADFSMMLASNVHNLQVLLHDVQERADKLKLDIKL